MGESTPFENERCRACGQRAEFVFGVRLDRNLSGAWSPLETALARPVCTSCRDAGFRDGILSTMHAPGAEYVRDQCDGCHTPLFAEAWVVEYTPVRTSARDGRPALAIQYRVCSVCVLRIAGELDGRVPGRGHLALAVRGAMLRHGIAFPVDAPEPPPRAVPSATLGRLALAAFEQGPWPSGFFTLSGRLLFANSALRALGDEGLEQLRTRLHPELDGYSEGLPLPLNAPDGLVAVPIRNSSGDVAAVLAVVGPAEGAAL